MPWSSKPLSSVSCDTMSPPAAGGGAAAAAGCCACCCSYCCCSCCDHLLAWRRETLFETWVAVPAMTAVRATPRRSPGMRFVLFLCGGFEGGQDVVHRDEPAGDELGAAAAQR